MTPSSGGDQRHARLTLVGTPIGNLGDLSPRAVETLRHADVIAAEDTRRTKALLTHAGIPAGRRVRSVRAENERRAASALVRELRAGAHVAFVTDAGMPGISDPGEALVRACLDADLPVEAVPGPSALVAALVLSGLPSDRFVFEGFLPRKGGARRERLESVGAETRTTILFESPRRVAATLADLEAACGGDRPSAVARELTKAHEEVWRGSLADAVRALSGEARGEHVIVVGGAAERDSVGDDIVSAAVDRALDAGASPRDAAAEVSRTLRIPRRRAYEMAITRRRP